MGVKTKPTHETKEMKVGDGYTVFSMFGARDIVDGGNTPYHGTLKGEVFAHATYEAAGPVTTKVDKTLRDLFISGIDIDDIALMGTFGGTQVEGFKILLDRTILENEISQEQSSIESLIIGDKVSMELVVKEITFEKLALLLGMNPSTIETTLTKTIWTTGDTGAPGDVDTIKMLGVGGVSTIPFFSMMHRVVDSRQSVGGKEVYEWHYFPRCQIEPSSEIAFVKDGFISMNAKIIAYPSKQLHVLTAGSFDYKYDEAETDPTTLYYTMRSAEGKGKAFLIFREYVA